MAEKQAGSSRLKTLLVQRPSLLLGYLDDVQESFLQDLVIQNVLTDSDLVTIQQNEQKSQRVLALSKILATKSDTYVESFNSTLLHHHPSSAARLSKIELQDTPQVMMLKKEIQALKIEQEMLKESMKEYIRSNIQLKESNQIFQAQLTKANKEAQKKNEEHNDSISKMIEEMEALRKANTKLEAEKQAYFGQLQTASGVVAKHREEQDTLWAISDLKNQEIDTQRKIMKDLRKSKKALECEISDLNIKLKETVNGRRDISEQHQKLEVELNKYKTELGLKPEAAQREVEETIQQLVNTENYVRPVHEIKADVEIGYERLILLIKREDELQVEKNKLERRIKEKEEELADLEQQIKAKKEEHAILIDGIKQEELKSQSQNDDSIRAGANIVRVSDQLTEINKWKTEITPWDLAVKVSGDVAVCGYFVEADIYSPEGEHRTSLIPPEDAVLYAITCHDNRLMVSDQTSKGVLVFTDNGEYLHNINMDVEKICGVAVHMDKMYVTSDKEHGAVYYTHLQPGSPSKQLFVEHTKSHPLVSPRNISVHKNRVAVACSTCVQIYDIHGYHVTTLRDNTGRNEFTPGGVVIDNLGHVIVSDYDNHRVVLFNTSGQLVKVLQTDNTKPRSLALAPSNTLWVGYYLSNTVCEYKYTQ